MMLVTRSMYYTIKYEQKKNKFNSIQSSFLVDSWVRKLKKYSKVKISRITAVDPMSPLPHALQTNFLQKIFWMLIKVDDLKGSNP